jgi:hypothetical protein
MLTAPPRAGCKDSRFGIAARTGGAAAPQHAVNMDVPVGHDFGPGADRRGDDEIGPARINLGARPDGLGHQP